MKKIVKIFLLQYILLSTPVVIYCQGFFKNTLLTGHIGLGGQDKRLFNQPQAANLLRLDYNHVDYETGITIRKSAFTYKFLQVMVGLGYSQYSTNFPRPFDHTQINGGFTDEPRKVKVYRLHQLILPATLNIYLNAKKSIFVNTIFRPAFILNKTGIDRILEKKASKWKFEYGGFEILPGIGAQIGQRWWLNLNYRWYYMYKIDRVLFYQALRPPQSFIEKKYDTYNPFQMQLTVGYWIRKK